MATRALTFLEILASRSTIARTSTTQKSWASAALWRRVFGGTELEENEEPNVEDETSQKLEDGQEVAVLVEQHLQPIAAPKPVQARREFSKEFWQTMTQPSLFSSQTPDRVLEQPNLQIPIGEEYRYMAQ